MKCLHLVKALTLPDCWVAAGFVRDAVWDSLHGLSMMPPWGDSDVVWFDAGQTQVATDGLIERALRKQAPERRWSVKNQARMHIRNHDAPYTNVAHAMRHWPETATAIAVRLNNDGHIEVNAPFGLTDLFQLTLRPGPSFQGAKKPVFDERVRKKKWLSRYPQLQLVREIP